tara:strand:- start:52 stop:582 length:531 start_codon:yes stop_codon:yes gene_type:complete
MRLLMESWRSYILLEGVKNNEEEAEKFINLLSQEEDEQVVDTYTEKLETDPDVQRVVADLEKMFSDVTEEANAELEENLEDLSLQAGVTVLNVQNKIEKYIQTNPVGRRLARYGAPLIGLAVASITLGGVAGGGVTNPSKGMRLAMDLATGPLTGNELAQAAIEFAAEGINEKRNQ